MTSYIALLRGINVGGHRSVKMADLTTWLNQSGVRNVKTYLQSGNAVFDASQSATELQEIIQATLLAHTKHSISVWVRSQTAWSRLIAGNPFLKLPGTDISKLHVTLLAKPVARAQVKDLVPRLVKGEAFTCVKDCVYLYCPQGYGNTKMSNQYFERVLDCAATTRNWKTVLALRDLRRG